MRFVALLVLCAALGCGDDDAVDPDGGPVIEDAAVVVDAAPAVDAPPADTWATYAESFFATYCTECHDGGTRDYTTIDEVRRDQVGIACGVSLEPRDGCGPAPGQFPVGAGPYPSDEERARLVAWIDAGLME